MLIVIPCLEKMALCAPVCSIIKKRVPEIRSVVSSKNSEKAEFWESATSWGTVIALCTGSFLFSESFQAGSGTVTAKPAETRMGSGKGALEYWVAVVKPGRVMFEIAGVPEETAKEALRLAMHKLPCKCKIASKADLEGGDNSEN